MSRPVGSISAIPPQGTFSAVTLAALLGAAGMTHFLSPGFYTPIVPDQLGAPEPWVYGSGVVELACAAALVPQRTRRVAGWATAALFVAVFPANVQMALDAGNGSATYRAIVYARLPLQLPLVLWAAGVARRAARP